MSQTQCIGVTLKGHRCLKKVSGGRFCHYHISQNGQATTSHSTSPQPKAERKPKPKPKVPPKAQPPTPQTLPQKKFASPNKSANGPGFIYVYTLQSFLQDKSGSIKTRNLIGSERHKDQWVDMKTKDSKILLIKVGMTSKTPAARISQWEAKCNHKLQCLYPNSHQFKSTSFLDHFRRLSLKNRPAESRFLSTFSESHKGFYVSREVLRCERDIHGLLKAKFGRGEIHCTGCVEKSRPASPNPILMKWFKPKEQDFNVHNEWFPIPKNMIQEVYNIIDSVCRKYR